MVSIMDTKTVPLFSLELVLYYIFFILYFFKVGADRETILLFKKLGK